MSRFPRLAIVSDPRRICLNPTRTRRSSNIQHGEVQRMLHRFVLARGGDGEGEQESLARSKRTSPVVPREVSD
jgi:hypothetical protein